jgi:hypothetical protein
MGLLQNGYRHNLTGRLAGATNLDGWNPCAGVYNKHCTAASRNQFAGPAITDDLAAVPAGNRHPSAWIMPRKAGGLASHNEANGSGTATLAMASGINIAGVAAGETTAAAGTLQLVVSMLGTSAGAAAAEGNIRAALLLAGIAEGLSTPTATINALAWAIGSAAGISDASMTSYATGRLVGSITPFTDLSPQNLAAAVIAAAQAEPIHADIRRVNSYAVDGDGQTGTEWGPA